MNFKDDISPGINSVIEFETVQCLSSIKKWYKYEPRSEKTGLRVSDQTPHKPGSTTTQDG